MAITNDLNLNERKVLYGLVRYPEEPAIHIAEHMGIPQPTFSNIQRRLKHEDAFTTVTVPDLRALGIDLTMVMFGTFNPLSKDQDRKALETTLKKANPEIFFMVTGVHDILIFLASKDFTELNVAAESIEKAYVESGVMDRAAFSKVTFPLETTLLARWFDYANPLYKKFGFTQSDAPPPQKIRKVVEKTIPIASMNPSEKRVLLHLLEHPDASDIAMSKALSLSRATVAKAKTRLISDRLIIRSIIPNIKRLGFEVFVFSDVEFKPETTYDQRLDSTEWLLEKLPIIVSIISNKQALTLYAFESYHLLQELKRLALQEYMGKGYIKGEIKVIVFSASEIELQPALNFVPIIRKVIGLSSQD